MLEILRSLFSASEKRETADGGLDVAVAALLVEAARADDVYDEREKELIDQSLAAHFGLDPARAAGLRSRGEAAQAAANDLHRFTKIAKTMSGPDKISLIERMWEIVLSDDERDPHEEALIRRVCGLIYVSDPESGAARHRVESAMAASRG